MQVIKNLETYPFSEEAVVTVGKFDGLHRGHRLLIERAVELARERSASGEKTLSVVFAIDMAPVMLLSKRERRHMLAELGVDLLVEYTFNPSFITTSAEDFVRKTLLQSLHAAAVVVGEDFRFGYGRRGDGEMLERLGGELGFASYVLPDVFDGAEKISSSRIREAVAAGRMEEAREMLGYPYFVTGEIIHGRQIGRTIGVPTANLITDQSKYLPPNGVYYTSSTVNGRTYSGVTNVGTKPTVDGNFVGVETYFFDCEEDLYGEDLIVRLQHFARPECTFPDLEALKAQIARDEEGARDYFAQCHTRSIALDTTGSSLL